MTGIGIFRKPRTAAIWPSGWIMALVLMAMIVDWPGVVRASPGAGPDRKAGSTAAIHSSKPNNMRLVFEAAYQAMLIGEPLAAAGLLDHVSTILPTPAVLNNAGIARAMHAVSLYDKQEPQLMYPWVLDTAWRPETVEIVLRTVPRTRGSKWVAEARDQLIRASFVGPQDRLAVINHLSVEGLRGRLGTVSDDAVVTIAIARDEGNRRVEALAWTARGIAYASCNDNFRDAAREDLLQAEKLGYELATLNLSILDGSSPLPVAASTKVDVEMFPEERIENMSPFESVNKFPEKPFGSFQIAASSRSSLPGSALSWKEHARAQMVTLRIIPVEPKAKAKTYVLLRTLDGYAGQTGRGLVLGSRVEEIRQAYGTPSRILDQLEGQFLIYDVPRLVFEVKQDRLAGWMLYESIP